MVASGEYGATLNRAESICNEWRKRREKWPISAIDSAEAGALARLASTIQRLRLTSEGRDDNSRAAFRNALAKVDDLEKYLSFGISSFTLIREVEKFLALTAKGDSSFHDVAETFLGDDHYVKSIVELTTVLGDTLRAAPTPEECVAFQEEGAISVNYLGRSIDTLWGWRELAERLMNALITNPTSSLLSKRGAENLSQVTLRLCSALFEFTKLPNPSTATHVLSLLDEEHSVLSSSGMIFLADTETSITSANRAKVALEEILASSREAASLTKSVGDILDRTRDGTLTAEFEKSAIELQNSSDNWRCAALLSLCAFVVTGSFAAWKISLEEIELIVAFIPVELALSLVLWFSTRQHAYTENLSREYRFKAISASVLVSFQKIIESAGSEEARSFAANFSKMLFSPPSARLGKPPVEQAVKVLSSLLQRPEK